MVPRTGWAAASGFDKNGGFTALKREATAANSTARRAGTTLVAEEVATRAEAVRTGKHGAQRRAERAGFRLAGTASRPSSEYRGDGVGTMHSRMVR